MDELKKAMENLRWYKETNEEMGVVYVPLFVIDNALLAFKSLQTDKGQEEAPDAITEEHIGHGLNESAVKNVENHIIVQMERAKEAEKSAISEGRIPSQIDMYRDMRHLWSAILGKM